MNDTLLNPFAITHPTTVQTSLIASGLFARFDRSGRYIAVGKYDGNAGIWDLETKEEVRTLQGHVKSITSIDWSRHSRYLITSSKDWNVVIWDLKSDITPPQRQETLRFDAPVQSAMFHPRNSKIVLAVLIGEAVLVDLRQSSRGRTELEEEHPEVDEDGQPLAVGMSVAKFDPSGKYIFVGTSAGTLLVFHTRTKAMVGRHRIPGASTLKGLEFAKSGRRLVTNSSDRVLREFTLPVYPPPGELLDTTLEATHRFNDPISKTAWHNMCYSPDGEWLAGGAADPSGHKIYIWDMANDGQFSSTLDGGSEPLTYVHWHPTKSCIASTTKRGVVLIWHSPNTERWGAFAGGFEELDENVEYEEREDEFDIEDQEEILRRKMKEEEADVDIDTITTNGSTEHSTEPLGGEEEDFAWADIEPDDDLEDFTLKPVMVKRAYRD